MAGELVSKVIGVADLFPAQVQLFLRLLQPSNPPTKTFPKKKDKTRKSLIT